MILSYKKIFDAQSKLDSEILKKFKKNYSNTFNERKLALLVEIGEMANEVRSFKYWSIKPASPKEVILGEYVDILHFIVGFCLQFNIKDTFKIKEINHKKQVNITKKILKLYKIFIKLDKSANHGRNKSIIKKFFKKFILLGFALKFTNEDIFNGYFKKNEINHQRQKNKY